MKINPCKNCNEIPIISKEYIGYSICCINCYDSTPQYSYDPPNNAYLVIGYDKTELIKDWNNLAFKGEKK